MNIAALVGISGHARILAIKCPYVRRLDPKLLGLIYNVPLLLRAVWPVMRSNYCHPFTLIRIDCAQLANARSIQIIGLF